LFIRLAVIIAAGAAAIASAAVRAADLVVVVEGVRNGSGDVVLGVFSDPKQWPDGDAVVDGSQPAAPTPLTFVFKNLPSGTYAISGFHDANRNGKFDTDFLGIPLEGFAFSNDVHPILSAPSFSSAAFELAGTVKTLRIHMQYWDAMKNRAR
jgi:uncharacterized protein (DUF2141 family)